MEQMKWIKSRIPKSDDAYLPLMGTDVIARAQDFHRSFPQYKYTPLADLQGLARELGIGELHVKDESYRFGLNSFKVLGGSFAIASYLAKEMGRDLSEMTYDYLTSEQFRKEFGQATFFSATDGNHGRGVAWSAAKLGQKCVIYMPRGTSQSRYDNIAKEGAEVSILDANYDECVRIAAQEAEKVRRAVIVQDTAWEGYTDIPNWIMQGYGVMAKEAADQLEETGRKRPTHVFVQAGVGSMAASAVGYLANRYADDPPVFIVMECAPAACYFKGAEAADGEPRVCTGDLDSIMAGLACGEPNLVAWDILKNHTKAYVSCPDYLTARGMRMLAAPVKGDPVVVSGESGAIGTGVVAEIMRNPAFEDLREELGLDGESRVLLFSTEGNTDPVRYKRIVWEGAYATPE